MNRCEQALDNRTKWCKKHSQKIQTWQSATRRKKPPGQSAIIPITRIPKSRLNLTKIRKSLAVAPYPHPLDIVGMSPANSAASASSASLCFHPSKVPLLLEERQTCPGFSAVETRTVLLCSGLAVACGSDAFDNAILHNLKELRTYVHSGFCRLGHVALLQSAGVAVPFGINAFRQFHIRKLEHGKSYMAVMGPWVNVVRCNHVLFLKVVHSP